MIKRYRMIGRMKSAVRSAAVIFIFLLPGITVGAQAEPSGRDLVNELRRGGYTIYFRHAATDPSQADHVVKPGDWTSCDPGRMRQLSPDGRAEAGRIGDSMRKLSIPVGRILSSEYCRTYETAKLLDLGQVETTKSLMNMLVADMVGGREAVAEAARLLMGERPRPGTNTVLVAHGNVLLAATGEYTVEAGAMIFRTENDGSITRIAEITPEKWRELEEFAGNRS